MAQVQRPDESTVNLPNLSFDGKTRTFVLSDSSGEFEYPFRYSLRVVSEDDTYKIFWLYKKGVRHEDIFHIWDASRENRLGWAFPIQALTSNEHSYCENDHFLKAAFKTYHTLLSELQFEEIEGSSDEYYDKLTFLHQDLVILALSSTAINKHLPDFNIRDFYPYLYSHGFTTQATETLSNYIEDLNGKTMLIKKISPCFADERFLGELFDTLIYESHPLVKFHVLYQVIEICLDKVLLNELRSLTQDVKDKKVYGLEIRKKFESFEAEKKRINKLFTEYYRDGKCEIRALLQTECRSFITAIGKTIPDNSGFAEILYTVRNAIVHDYRNTSPGAAHLETIDEILPHLICDLLVKYSEDFVNDASPSDITDSCVALVTTDTAVAEEDHVEVSHPPEIEALEP